MFGPIFWIELLTSGRRARYIVARTIYAIALLVALWGGYSAHRGPIFDQNSANLARTFFTTFAFVQLAALLMLAPAMTAGTIAVEHERKTIEYLLTSQLSVADIVLGKLTARIAHVLFILLTGLPIVMLASLLGGIPPMSVALVACITGLTLMAVVSLSLAISVRARRSREAVVRAYVVLTALLIVPPLLGSLLRGWGYSLNFSWMLEASRVLLEGTALFHPVSAMIKVFTVGSSGVDLQLGWFAIGYGAFSLVCVLSSLYGVRRTYLKAAGAGSRRRKTFRFRRRPLVGKRAMLWKEMVVERSAIRLGLVGRIALLLLIGAMVVPLTGMLFDPEGLKHYVMIATCGFGMLILLLIAARSASSITSEKERDCWTMLISTPLSPSAIIAAKLFGNLYAMRWLFAVLLVLWTVQVLVDPTAIVAWFVRAITLGLLGCYAGLLGLSFSLRSKGSIWAMAGTVATGVFFGGGYLFCCCFPMAIGGGLGEGAMLGLAPCIPYLLAASSMFAEDFSRRESGVFYMTQIIGLTIYAGVSACLWAYCIGNFDRLAGRMHPVAMYSAMRRRSMPAS